MNIDLTDAQQQQIMQVLTDTLGPGIRVYVFGSRARGDARPFSDLDLLLDANNSIAYRDLALTSELLADSDLPFAVDVSDNSRLSDVFRRRIEADIAPIGVT
ncbi:MAG: nucleotidyltransferase domain-containing protein [Marinobacterium sp.]|nr:nucleotidyltransferase domain-containing protein [Marinobacterium sp.]